MFIRHFVATGIVFYEKTVLLVKHKQFNKWLPPGGHIEDNELPEEALLREIIEETSCKVEIVTSQDIDLECEGIKVLKTPFCILNESVEENNVIHFHIDMIFICKALSKYVIPNDKEMDDIGWFDIETINALETFPNLPILVKKAHRYYEELL